MESEQEKIQILGLFGIYKESYKIIFSWRKIFNQITLTLIIPLSFIFLIQIQVTDVQFEKILNHSNQLTKTQFNTLYHQKLIEIISKEYATFILFKLIYFILILTFYLFSTSAVVYTVASIYTNRDITFINVMSVVSKVWKRLMVTFLCTLVAGFLYNTMAIVISIISMLIFRFGVRSGGNVFVFMITIIGILYLVGLIYLTVIWQLSNVVTVLEDSYGFEAMTKSKELIKGKIGLSIIITLVFNFFFFLIQFLFGIVVVNGWKLFELSLMNRVAFGFLCLLLLCHLFLLIQVIQTVLYFVCKSYLKIHQILGEYETLKSKDVQLQYHQVCKIDEQYPV